MKISKFKALNYKGIKEFEVIPDGNLVIVSGKNGAGKSSILDGITNILAGKNKIIKQPIRNGKDKAELEMIVEDENNIKFNIKKTFTEKGELLQIINEEGLKYSSPQSLLKKITGDNNFDPNDFLNKSEKEQREDLIKFSNIDLNEVDQKIDEIYNFRHQVGIEGKALAQYTNDEIENAKKYQDEKEINITEITNTLEIEQEKHRDYQRSRTEIEENLEEIESLKLRIQKLESANKKFEEMKKPESNIEEIKKQIENADSENKKIMQSKQILENTQKVNQKKEQWNKLDNEYKEQQEKRQKLLSEIELPLEGLKVTETDILFNDVPIKQLSTSEGLKIAIAMYVQTCISQGIQLKLCIIKNGNDFDDKSIKNIAQIIEGYEDLTIFMERVVNDKDEAVGIYIENGKIK